jgi:hypothetical protein
VELSSWSIVKNLVITQLLEYQGKPAEYNQNCVEIVIKEKQTKIF